MDKPIAEHADSLLIDQLGGTVATAALAEVTSSAVSQWRRSGIPRARLMFLRLVRPDVFAASPAQTPEPAPATQPDAA